MLDRPDIVLVMTDEQRFDWVGHQSDGFFETPVLDRLASRGVVFSQGWSASTTCVPSRTSLLTGTHHHRVPQQPGSIAIRPGTWTVAHELRAAGYETALIGRMHFRPIHADHGFETMRMCENVNPGSGYGDDDVDDYLEWLRASGRPDWRRFDTDADGELRHHLPGVPRPFPEPAEFHPTAWIERETVSFLRERTRDRPLFLVVSFPHPHAPYDPPEPYASMYDAADVVIPADGFEVNEAVLEHFATGFSSHPGIKRRTDDDEGEAHYRAVMTAIRGLVRQIDDSLRRVVDELDLERSLLVFTADHGDYGGHRGLYTKVPWIPFDDLLRVPLVAAGGVVESPGRTVERCVQTGSFAATCLELAGLDPGDEVLDFPSLVPDLVGRPVPGPEHPVIAAISVGYPTIRIGDLKVIGSWNPGEVLLFDLATDPSETRPLTNDPAHADLLAEAAALFARELAKPPLDLPIGWAARPT